MSALDQGFVMAPPEPVYGALADPATYGTWWPGAEREGPRVRLWGRRPLSARAETLRDGIGLILHLEGPATGTLEWYLEPFEDGTIVNAILNLDLPEARRRSERRLLEARAAIRRGLVGLQRHLEAP